MARRSAVDRVFGTDHDRSTDNFPAVGDGETEIADVSGMPGSNMMEVRRPRTVEDAPPGRHLSHRQARMIDAQSGETFDAGMQRTTLRAVRKAENVKAAAGDDRLMYLFTGR